MVAHVIASWLTHEHLGPEPGGAGNGWLAGSFVSVMFSIVIPFRAVPDLVRSALKIARIHRRHSGCPQAALVVVAFPL